MSPITDTVLAVELNYMTGFGNDFQSQALPDAIPIGQNSPQKPKYGLYAEQINGTSFLASRHENLRSWLYRIKPSVLSCDLIKADYPDFQTRPFRVNYTKPLPYRWDPLVTDLNKSVTFLDSIITIAGNGDLASVRGSAIHLYAFNQNMQNQFFHNADGDFLIVPYRGNLLINTEFGKIDLKPGEIALIPRGIKFNVNNLTDFCAGYILENYGPHFRLPNLGPIGSNGLANPRDFLTPVASFEDKQETNQLIFKASGQFFKAEIEYSPLNVVAFHGNYVPYKYDLSMFQVINTVSFDHCDPSIFTVLTSPSELPAYSNVDFVIFPPRWLVSEHSFRPPYYHKNFMSEYMGLIKGTYEAKEENFIPGGGTLHNQFTAHGPDSNAFNKASNEDLTPKYLANTMAFMFESSLTYHLTQLASVTPKMHKNYLSCWADLPKNFRT